MTYKILLIAFSLTTLYSCKIIKSMSELRKEHAKVYTYAFGSKDIKYIPMHHLGKQEFFDDVKLKIEGLKKEGYIVYFEQISTDLKTDSLQKDIIRRKVRKIKGFNGTYQDAAKGTMLEKYVQQPSCKQLGITAGDKRADVDYLQFINEWEKLNGKIVLDSVDLNTSFSAPYYKGTFYTKEQYENIIIRYRNQYLVDMINTGTDSKILIIYGAGHQKDFKKKLKLKIK